MANFYKSIYKEIDLTFISVYGNCDFVELLEVEYEFYWNDTTSNLLWDCSQAKFANISNGRIEASIEHSMKNLHTREGGRDAFVFHDDLGFGLGRVYQSLSAIRGFPVKIRPFRTMDDAWRWLGGNLPDAFFELPTAM